MILANEPGVMMPYQLPVEAIDKIEARIGDEYAAHYFYRNAANWCKNVNYKKAAEFFEKEAENELIHAKGLQDYLTSWNMMPKIPTAPTTRSFSGLVDLINQAYSLEYDLFIKYSEDQTALFSIHPATFNFIQTYTTGNRESVAEYSDLLNALQLINVESKLDLLTFEKRYF
jgi:ferritin